MERCNERSGITHNNGEPALCELHKGHDSGKFPREVETEDRERNSNAPRVFLLHATPHRTTIEWPSS